MLIMKAVFPLACADCASDQQAAGWVKPENVLRVVSPEDLSVAADLLRSPFITSRRFRWRFSLRSSRGRGRGG